MKRLSQKELKSLNESCSSIVNDNQEQLDEGFGDALAGLLRSGGRGVRAAARMTNPAGRAANARALRQMGQRVAIGAEEAGAKVGEFFTARPYSAVTSTAKAQRAAASQAYQAAQDAAKTRILPELQRIQQMGLAHPRLANLTPGQRLQVQQAFKQARGMVVPATPTQPATRIGRDWVKAEELLLSTHPGGGAQVTQQALAQGAQKGTQAVGGGAGMGLGASLLGLGVGGAAYVGGKFLSTQSSVPGETVGRLEQGAAQGLSRSLGIPELERQLQSGIGGRAGEEFEARRQRK